MPSIELALVPRAPLPAIFENSRRWMGTEEDPRGLLKPFPSELLSVSPGIGNTKIIPFSKEYENELVGGGCPQDEVFPTPKPGSDIALCEKLYSSKDYQQGCGPRVHPCTALIFVGFFAF